VDQIRRRKKRTIQSVPVVQFLTGGVAGTVIVEFDHSREKMLGDFRQQN
jgi:hypothetical protein